MKLIPVLPHSRLIPRRRLLRFPSPLSLRAALRRRLRWPPRVPRLTTRLLSLWPAPPRSSSSNGSSSSNSSSNSSTQRPLTVKSRPRPPKRGSSWLSSTTRASCTLLLGRRSSVWSTPLPPTRRGASGAPSRGSTRCSAFVLASPRPPLLARRRVCKRAPAGTRRPLTPASAAGAAFLALRATRCSPKPSRPVQLPLAPPSLAGSSGSATRTSELGSRLRVRPRRPLAAWTR